MATSTPWGLSDSSKKYAPGIIFYSTPSHGGFHVSAKKFASMPAALKKLAYPREGWFEEDAAWAAVALAFREHFTHDEIVNAKSIVKHYYPEAFKEIFPNEK